MDLKKVAKYAVNFIGGKPKIFGYDNEDESGSIDILTSTTGVIRGIPTCATIGLADMDIGLEVDGKPLRVELMAAGDIDSDKLEQMLSSMAFDVMDVGTCHYGMVIPGGISRYDRSVEVKHAVLLSPVFWPDYQALEGDDRVVSWLYAVPVTDAERSFIEQNGVDAFENLLELKRVDVLDFSRKSAL